jgi:hypothetical protein
MTVRLRPDSNGVREARRGLIAAGFGAPLSAAAVAKGSLARSTPEAECALLAEIAAYIEETDPLMIGAAWLLEQCGYERTQLSLLPGPHTEAPESELTHETNEGR